DSMNPRRSLKAIHAGLSALYLSNLGSRIPPVSGAPETALAGDARQPAGFSESPDASGLTLQAAQISSTFRAFAALPSPALARTAPQRGARRWIMAPIAAAKLPCTGADARFRCIGNRPASARATGISRELRARGSALSPKSPRAASRAR